MALLLHAASIGVVWAAAAVSASHRSWTAVEVAAGACLSPFFYLCWLSVHGLLQSLGAIQRSDETLPAHAITVGVVALVLFVLVDGLFLFGNLPEFRRGPLAYMGFLAMAGYGAFTLVFIQYLIFLGCRSVAGELLNGLQSSRLRRRINTAVAIGSLVGPWILFWGWALNSER